MGKSIRDIQKARRRSNILERIRTAGMLSRVDLARETGLSKASVTGIISELIEEGLLIEKEAGAYEGGRRPILLAMNPGGAYAIGVNLSLEMIRVVIINFNAEIEADYIFLLEKEHYEPEEIAEKTARAIQACMWESNFSREQISGVGIGVPGLVDSKGGTICFLPNYGWSNVPFGKILEEKINHPVFVDNDSNNLANAERWYGQGKGIDNYLVVTLENGVGSGIVVNGNLMRGHLGISSEFGHMCIDPAGPLCRCGGSGCVESYVGNNALIRDSKALIAAGRWQGDVSEESLTYDHVLEELARGTDELVAVYERAGEVLGIGLRNLITLFNPTLIILTGKGTQAGDALLQPMYRSMEQVRSKKFGSIRTELIVNDWTEEDWARGAGTLVLQELYNHRK